MTALLHLKCVRFGYLIGSTNPVPYSKYLERTFVPRSVAVFHILWGVAPPSIEAPASASTGVMRNTVAELSIRGHRESVHEYKLQTSRRN